MTAVALLRDRRGVAMIEFAYMLPVVLLAGLGALESANLVLAHMKISRITSMTADNASRVRNTIDEQDVTELFLGAQLSSGSLNLAENGRVIVSQLEENPTKTGQWIRWQRCYGAKAVVSSYGLANAGKNDASLPGMGPTGRQVAADTGTAVDFVEVVYDYKPLVQGVYGGLARTLRYTAAFNVRKRTPGDLANSASLPPKDKNPCS